jgi:hypothetical protein
LNSLSFRVIFNITKKQKRTQFSFGLINLEPLTVQPNGDAGYRGRKRNSKSRRDSWDILSGFSAHQWYLKP